VEYIPVDFSKTVIPTVLQALYERKLYSILVEGGGALHQSFLDAGLWDEMRIETSPVRLGHGVKAISVCLDKVAEKQINNCEMSVYYNKSGKFINNCKQMGIKTIQALKFYKYWKI
jgi:riboflavin biosynthesis pyrimidine reductase